MKILIIGVKGFIGSYLYKYFSSFQIYHCWGCDVVPDYSNRRYFVIDSTSIDFYNLFEFKQFDICINCSGAASVPDSLIQPLRDFTLNSFNVFKILDAIRKYNKECKFLNLSSAAVYGNPCNLPIREFDNLQPISPYGIHKLMSEEICKEFNIYYGLSTCSIRIFSAYGEGLKKQLFFDLYIKTKNNSEIRLFGDGEETREFIYIEDIAKAIELIILRANFSGESINVANALEVSIKNVVDLFAKLTNWNGNIIFTGDSRRGDPLRWQADNSILKSFGYRQSISLEAGLKNYIQWASENI